MVVVEKIFPPENNVNYPICIGGERACPPEDCGGFIGYNMILEHLNNPEDGEIEEPYCYMIEDFDPVSFDLERVNAILNNDYFKVD